MRRVSALSLFVVVASTAAAFLAAPYLCFAQMKSAMRDRNPGMLANYVDFPAVRDSLRTQFGERLMAEAGKGGGGGPFAAVGAALGAAVMNPLIDGLVTPDALALMVRGSECRQREGRSSDWPAVADLGCGPMASASYEDMGHFVITFADRGGRARPAAFVMTREGVFTWRVTAIRLPGDVLQ